jgi:hypothetical protein
MKKQTLALLGVLVLSSAAAWTTAAIAQPRQTQAPKQLTLELPNAKGSFRFALLGDTGTGTSEQAQVGAMLTRFRAVFPFEDVLMVGDNLYGGESTRDYVKKFESPYKDLLSAGVKFYAALGNHDDSNQRFYKNFNMNGERFYTFKPRDGVRIVALDSNYLDKPQIEWLDKELAASGSEWKIVFFHHPLYSSGRTHGPSVEVREVLEPIFVKRGVSVVLAGHEHFYERIKPQKGIAYFILGNSAKLRKGDIRKTGQSEKAYDSDYGFMLAEIDGDRLHFQAISRSGQTFDKGVIERVNAQAKAAP